MSFQYENVKLSLSDQITFAQKYITNRNTSDNTSPSLPSPPRQQQRAIQWRTLQIEEKEILSNAEIRVSMAFTQKINDSQSTRKRATIPFLD